MPKEIKLFILSKELNVGVGSLKDSLERRGFPNAEAVNPNTKVSLDLASQLIQEHGKHLGKDRLEAILAKLTSPAPAKERAQEPRPAQEAPEKKPREVTHIDTVVPEDRRPSLNIKGSIKPTEPKPAPQPEVKEEPKVEVKPAPEPEKKVAKQEEPKPEKKAEPKPEVKPEAKAEVKAEAKSQPEPEKKAEPSTPQKEETKSEPKSEVKSEVKSEPKQSPQSKPATEDKPTPTEPH